jgi:hypothetical protein
MGKGLKPLVAELLAKSPCTVNARQLNRLTQVNDQERSCPSSIIEKISQIY